MEEKKTFDLIAEAWLLKALQFQLKSAQERIIVSQITFNQIADIYKCDTLCKDVSKKTFWCDKGDGGQNLPIFRCSLKPFVLALSFLSF